MYNVPLCGGLLCICRSVVMMLCRCVQYFLHRPNSSFSDRSSKYFFQNEVVEETWCVIVVVTTLLIDVKMPYRSCRQYWNSNARSKYLFSLCTYRHAVLSVALF